jgi:phosphoribosylanthranilate isomerase
VKVRVKVCGITRSEDALLAARLRVDALGFNFWPKSRRYVSPEAAAPIVRALPPGVLPVGVFVNPTRDEVLRATEVAGIRSIQLHGDEPPDFCASLPIPVVKGIRVTDSHSLAALASYEVAGFLLDSATSGYGGSGTPFDWSVAAEAASVVPIWLAGGLTPENVAEAVRLVRPHGVDVASGVESAPGVKSAERMEAFIRAAKEASG